MNLLSSTNPETDISILIVTYNSGAFIPQCISSLPNATPGLKCQLILIDNDSTDATASIAKESIENLSADFECHFIQNKQNTGFTKAQNQGLALATGHFILFLNPDTVLPPDSLHVLLSILRENDEIGVVAPQFLNPDGTIQASCRRFPKHQDLLFAIFGLSRIFPRSRLFSGWHMGDFNHKSPKMVDQPQGAFLLARRQLVEAVGHWDEKYPMFFSDVDWCRRVRQLGCKIRFSPEVSILHHKGHSIFTRRPQMLLSSTKSFIKWFWNEYPQPAYTFQNSIISVLLMLVGTVRVLIALLLQQKFGTKQ